MGDRAGPSSPHPNPLRREREEISFIRKMSAAKHLKDLEQQDFDRLLNWLDADRDRAGLLYERIRWRLVTILASRGCALAEELADETIDRVARRVADIEQIYVGDKAIYPRRNEQRAS